MPDPAPPYRRFADFYPYYLSEHSDRTCRRLHAVGTTLVLLTTVLALVSGHWLLLLMVPLWGYGFAWAGHFFYEHNRPATFRYPFYSLWGDFVMYADILRGRIQF